jgi:dephospho-CoA kinase
VASRIGLTGGIGSGKSTVLQMLVGHGAAAIDADAISRAATAAGGAAISALAAHFGAYFIGPAGARDRAKRRERIYADADARRRLEAIVHPIVGAGIAREVDAAIASGHRVIVFDIPLLVESGRWRTQLDRVLVVDCSAETQVARVTARSGWPAAQVEAIIAAQAPRSLRLSAADIVICNEALSLKHLAAEVEQVARSFGL